MCLSYDLEIDIPSLFSSLLSQRCVLFAMCCHCVRLLHCMFMHISCFSIARKVCFWQNKDCLTCLLMPKFHFIYLAQNLLKTRSLTCFEQKKSRGPGLRHVLSRKKSRGPGLRLVCDLVSDKSETWIDVMEFGL